MGIELTLANDNGPVTSQTVLFGAKTGTTDNRPDVFSIDLFYDYFKSRTDMVYATTLEHDSLNDFVNARVLKKGNSGHWDGENLRANGFADATELSDLATYRQLQEAVLSTSFDIPALDPLNSATVDPLNDLLLIHDASTGLYKSITPGNLVTAYDPDLQALTNLSGTGLASRTGSGTWATRSIAGTTGEITLTNGDGVSGNPTVSLPAALTFTSKTITGGTYASVANIGLVSAGAVNWNGDTALTRIATGRLAVGANELAQYPTLAGTGASQGAALIGVRDTAGWFTATTVEDALAESASFLQRGTGAVTRSTRGKNRDTVSILDFIPENLHADLVAGISTTDMGPYVQAAIAALPNFGTLDIPYDVPIASQITVTRGNFTITGGDRLNGKTGGFSAASNGALLSVEGVGQGTPRTVTAAVAKGATTITVNSTVGFTPGGWAELCSTDLFHGIVGQAGFGEIYKGELVQIQRVIDGTSVQLAAPTSDFYSYPGGVPRLTPISLLRKIDLAGISFYGTGNGQDWLGSTNPVGPRGLRLSYVEDYNVTACTFENFVRFGVITNRAINGSVIGNDFHGRDLTDVTNQGASQSPWFTGFYWQSSQGLTFAQNRCFLSRRIFDANGGDAFDPIPRTATIANNYSWGCQEAIGSHACDQMVYIGNVGVGCGGGIGYRGKNGTFVENHFVGIISPGNAIDIGGASNIGYPTGSCDSGRIIVKGNTCDSGGYGVAISGDFEELIHIGNSWRNMTNGGVRFYGQRLGRVVSSGNLMDGSNRDPGADVAFGFYQRNPSLGTLSFESCSVVGDTIRNFDRGIVISGSVSASPADNINLSQNTFIGIEDEDIRLGNGESGMQGYFGVNVVLGENVWSGAALALSTGTKRYFKRQPSVRNNVSPTAPTLSTMVVDGAPNLGTGATFEAGQRTEQYPLSDGGPLGRVILSTGTQGSLGRTGSINASSTSLTFNAAASVAPGTRVRIAGAGTAGGNHDARVVSIDDETSPLVVQIDPPAVTTVSGATCTYIAPTIGMFGDVYSDPNVDAIRFWDDSESKLAWLSFGTGISIVGTTLTLDSDLSTIGALTPTNDDIIQRKSGAWANRTMAQLMADLAALGTTFQPLDTDLTSIAALTTTSYGRNLLTLADGNALAALVDANFLTPAEGNAAYQPIDTELTAIAGLTSAADRLPYFTGSGTAALATFTTAGRALVDDADNTAQRATLGLGTTDTVSFGRGVFSDNSSSPALTVTQAGAGLCLLIEDQATDTTPLVVTGTGAVVLGSAATVTTVIGTATRTPMMQVQGTGDSNSATLNSRYSADTGGPTNYFAKSRNATVGSHTIVASGDALGVFTFAGSDGAKFVEAARITVAVDGTPGTDDMPGRIMFFTTPDGSNSAVEAARISNAGEIQMGGANTVIDANRLHVNRVYTVATLPTGAAGKMAFASDGRKNGEGAAAGTGVLVFHDGTAWRACDTGATVAA